MFSAYFVVNLISVVEFAPGVFLVVLCVCFLCSFVANKPAGPFPGPSLNRIAVVCGLF